MTVKIDKGIALASLSMTPLIDIVFLLLIFFLVATRFAEEERELDVLLPQASEAQPLVSQPKEMFVNVDEDGRYYVSGKILDIDQLYPVLKAAWVNNPHQASVVIRADKRCQFQYVVAVINACEKANIRHHPVTTLEGAGG